MKCIYCLMKKPLSLYSKTEHVVPQSFGMFKNNFVLKKLVCDECNQYFGDNLERILARDTLEGSSRFEFGLKNPEEFKSIGKKSRMIIKIAEGECKGSYAYKEYSQDLKKIVVKPVPQIGFLKKMQPEYEYFLLDQIPEKKFLEDNSFDLNHPHAIRVFGIDADTAREILQQKGIRFVLGGEVGPPDHINEEWLCKIDALIDSTIFRAIAKTAFNYLAYWEGRDFLLNRSFDSTRKYIRYGTNVDYPMVRVNNFSILGDEPIEGKRRLGHIITINWAADKKSIVAQVSFFNGKKYIISLARNFSGELRDIRRGHFFNVANQEIHDLLAIHHINNICCD